MFFRIYSSIAYFVSRNIFKIGLKVFFKLKVKGSKNIPAKGPFIVAGNHISYLDPAIVGSASRRRLYFITSDHLYKNRLAALWYNSVGCLRIKRGEPDHRAMRRILDYLKDGKPLAMFPEGTRSQDGRIKEPLSGIGFLALKSHVPVVPCLIKGSEKALPKNARFFTFTPISVYVGEPVQPKDFEYGGDRREAYQLFSKKVMNSIVQLGKIYGD